VAFGGGLDRALGVGLEPGVGGQERVAPVTRATSAPSAARRPVNTTLAPSWVNRSTMRRPIPAVPPVTTIDLPCNRPAIAPSHVRPSL
jgi:hypothetical protein